MKLRMAAIRMTPGDDRDMEPFFAISNSRVKPLELARQ
jgi:hypothetical protein